MSPFSHRKQHETTFKTHWQIETNRNKDLSNNGPGWQSVFEVVHLQSILFQICSLQMRKLVLVGAFVCNAGVSSLTFSCGISEFQLESRGNSSISRGISWFFNCIMIEYWLMLEVASASSGGGLGLEWRWPWPRGAFSKSRFLPLICTTSLGATDFQKNVLESGFLHMVHIQMSLAPKKWL